MAHLSEPCSRRSSAKEEQIRPKIKVVAYIREIIDRNTDVVTIINIAISTYHKLSPLTMGIYFCILSGVYYK